jgi:hypothetical protein
MLASRSDQKKTITYAAVFGVVLIVSGWLLYGQFIASKVGKSDTAPEKTASQYNLERYNVKNLHLELYERDDFIGLRPTGTRYPAVTELKIGKPNPFETAAALASTTNQ